MLFLLDSTDRWHGKRQANSSPSSLEAPTPAVVSRWVAIDAIREAVSPGDD
jgi:hypothetical protein